MKAVVFTLGCKVNECESYSIAQGLEKLGYEVTNELSYADLYVINTCAVTKEAEKKSRQTASRVKRINPKAKIVFMGCASQHNPSAFTDKSENCLVCGTFNKGKLLNHLNESGLALQTQNSEFEELPFAKPLRTRAFIKVQDGCDNFCSYCLIPYLRGRNRSRNWESILNEIELNNANEVVLTGINLSAYNYNGTDLTELIKKLCNVKCRIRLGSLEVNVITQEFLEALKTLKNFAPHFHLSLQSGSNKVLKDMNRHYTREEYMQKTDLIKSYFPDSAITTDIIAGYPTETEFDFSDTLSLIDYVKFSDIHPFIFSPREGTVAYKLKDLDYRLKKERLDLLLSKKETLKKAFAEFNENKILEYLPEEFNGKETSGYAENYLRIYLKGDYSKNGIIKVRVKEVYKDGALAEKI